jgi:ribosomal protein L11 methyltransferase
MIRLAVRCRAEDSELVLAELVQIAPGGVEEESGPGWVEYAIYGAEGELPDLGGVFAVTDRVGPGRGAEEPTGIGVVHVRSETIPDDWADRWRDFHEPTVIAGGRVVIRPSWEAGDGTAPVDVVIDPGQAFGTGAHPTTQMCVELLVDLADRKGTGGRLVDLGTGSAVLAIAAAKLGWGPVLGVDLEVAALDAARANAEANGVEIELERMNLREQAPPAAPTVVANLTAPILADVAGRLPGECERLVCSGLLAREADQVAAAFADAGLGQRDRRDSGDWSALLLERQSSHAIDP